MPGRGLAPIGWEGGAGILRPLFCGWWFTWKGDVRPFPPNLACFFGDGPAAGGCGAITPGSRLFPDATAEGNDAPTEIIQ